MTRDDGINLRWDVAKSTSTNISALTSRNGLRVLREAVALRPPKEGMRSKKSTPNTLSLIEQKPTGLQSLFGRSRVRRIDGVIKLCFQLTAT